MKSGRISLGKNCPLLRNTLFGWAVHGKSTESARRTKFFRNYLTSKFLQKYENLLECNTFPKSLLEGNKLENNRNKFSFNEGLISQNKTYHEFNIRSILFSKESQDEIKSDDKYLVCFQKECFYKYYFWYHII